MAPSISIRESIRWLPENASEPTSTLVLTSGENRFVDIRILRPTHGSEVAEAQEHILPQARLEWAFAGISHTTFGEPGPDGKAVVHSKWDHWIDSRHEDAESVNDEGDMIPLPDGRTLEKGEMVDPTTGRKTEYEEMWLDVAPLSTEPEKGERLCCVLTLDDDEHNARGMVVRVGQFCQGLLRVGSSVSLERWEWKEGQKDEGGKWKRNVRIGDCWLPCNVAMEAEAGQIKVGGEVTLGDYVWHVREVERF